MAQPLQREKPTAPLSVAPTPWDEFGEMRRQNLARWPTGADVHLDEAVAFHKALPAHRNLAYAMRRAAAEGKCLTQPRGGFGTLDLQLELSEPLERLLPFSLNAPAS